MKTLRKQWSVHIAPLWVGLKHQNIKNPFYVFAVRTASLCIQKFSFLGRSSVNTRQKRYFFNCFHLNTEHCERGLKQKLTHSSSKHMSTSKYDMKWCSVDLSTTSSKRPSPSQAHTLNKNLLTCERAKTQKAKTFVNINASSKLINSIYNFDMTYIRRIKIKFIFTDEEHLRKWFLTKFDKIRQGCWVSSVFFTPQCTRIIRHLKNHCSTMSNSNLSAQN